MAVPGPGCDLTKLDASGGESNEGHLSLTKGDSRVLCSEGQVSKGQSMQNMGIISQEMLQRSQTRTKPHSLLEMPTPDVRLGLQMTAFDRGSVWIRRCGRVDEARIEH